MMGQGVMRFFVTGVNGQLGHDVMNELHKRGHEGVGSGLAGTYAGIADGSAVTMMPYVSLDITDKEAVRKVIAGKLVEAGFKSLPTWQDAVGRYLKEAIL